MIDFVFTVDYEIYGNGAGGLTDLIYEPAQRLADLFRKRDARLVFFVEVAELRQIAMQRTDAAINQVARQVRQLYSDGFEVALHLHPQWWNARFENGRWRLDLREYNLCTLEPSRIGEIVDASLQHLCDLVGDPSFVPLAFRAGNWLFQPTAVVARVLASRGLRIDSSVFKGGLQRQNSLDYRLALGNGDYWRFSEDVNRPDPNGEWIELPIHTRLVPFWKMLTRKRFKAGTALDGVGQSSGSRLTRTLDFMRLRYPQKLDFCRMTLREMTTTMDVLIESDRKDPLRYRPVVAIGHTKDEIDFTAVGEFLKYLQGHHIGVTTFAGIYQKLAPSAPRGLEVPHVPQEVGLR